MSHCSPAGLPRTVVSTLDWHAWLWTDSSAATSKQAQPPLLPGLVRCNLG